MRYELSEVSTLDMRELTRLSEAAKWQRKFQARIMEHSAHHISATFYIEGIGGVFI